ncbi:heterokaryon incompatibility protein-domain-containing protein [Penicillium verhagenii]|nr:heterokaryon incompatibility protein-domain-containing protein [Penicillium verhagenii]
MSVADEQPTMTEERYRPLDTSTNEIRLLSFQTTTKDTPVRLNLHYVSLNDWRPEYVTFRDQNTSQESSRLSEAWSEHVEFTLDMPHRELYKIVSRFNWGDYICLSHTWGDCDGDQATIFLNGVATAVSKHLEAALRALQSSVECELGMRVWVDALCINQADLDDRNEHVLRVKDIFGRSFSVTSWVNESGNCRDFHEPGESLLLCDNVMNLFGRQTLEELLGMRDRDWGTKETEDEQIMAVVRDIDVLIFDQFHWTDSDDDDDYGLDGCHLSDSVCFDLMMLFRKNYWSRLWIIQELAVCPVASKVYWGDSTFDISTLQVLCEILSPMIMSGEAWKEMKPGVDLLAFITTWRKLEATPEVTERFSDNTVRELNLLTQQASCSLPQDTVFAILGLFPSSISSSVVIDYSREATEIIAEFSSMVPEWNCS